MSLLILETVSLTHLESCLEGWGKLEMWNVGVTGILD